MGFEPLQEVVGWDLEQNVRYEKDGEGNILLIAPEMEVFWEFQGKRIGDVHP